MKIESSAFENNTAIPQRYACDGLNINPPLYFSEIPAETKSLAFILDDPDAAPSGNYTHWILWNIPPQNPDIAENSVPPNAVEGQNSAGKSWYKGPCPPSGTHHYRFQVFALDTSLALGSSGNRQQLEDVMKSHILAKGELTGTYQK